MLVLSRKVNEGITIGGNICVVVVAINGKQVRLGIEAPPGVPIFRDELLGDRGGAEATAVIRSTKPKIKQCGGDR